MGGLVVTQNYPAPRYDFELLHADDKSLFMHFRVQHGLSNTDSEWPCKRNSLGFIDAPNVSI